jgi:hypothetical protein
MSYRDVLECHKEEEELVVGFESASWSENCRLTPLTTLGQAR